jgi:diguanylate cyclase (GGDEF)-like protein
MLLVVAMVSRGLDMKKKIKIIIGTIIGLIVIGAFAFIIFNILNDKSKLSVDEKKWINSNLSTVQNVNVLNNVDVFGNNGYGVFFDFLNDFSKEYGIKVNPITYNNDAYVENGFELTNTPSDSSIIFYSDYYVLIGKNYQLIKNIDDLKSSKIGVLSDNYLYLSSYLTDLKLSKYSTKSDLENAFAESKDINYILVPRTEYTGYMIKNNYSFVYHFSDIKNYFIYQMKDNDVFSNILKKYYYGWSNKALKKSINSNLLKSFTNNLNLSEIDLKNLTSKVYNYGFVNNSPYEVLISGNYGGIVSEYLKEFSSFTGIEFKFTRYRNYNAFTNAVNDNNVDLYFNYYCTSNNFKTIDTGMDVNYYIIAKESNDLTVNSLQSLRNKTVYVLEDSILFDYLSTIDNITIKTYRNLNELKHLMKTDNIIMIDKETYDYMANKELSGYNIRYGNITNSTYTFKTNTDDTFTKLFSKYVMTQDPKAIKVKGLYNHNTTLRKGSLLGTIAKYILYIVMATILILYILYKSSKHIKISKKIKKEDKIKFIDQLTSLKNRNYLNENIDAWNKNTIYPQATVIIDLNKIQEINDTYGYESGDSQIKAAANILIRTQLDNSDIMRTDGNEFLVYLVGYDERSITGYIRKLYKEFKNMPYDYNAIIGYSMITDDLKTIEDAINESVDDMKNKKQDLQE